MNTCHFLQVPWYDRGRWSQLALSLCAHMVTRTQTGKSYSLPSRDGGDFAKLKGRKVNTCSRNGVGRCRGST